MACMQLVAALAAVSGRWLHLAGQSTQPTLPVAMLAHPPSVSPLPAAGMWCRALPLLP